MRVAAASTIDTCQFQLTHDFVHHFKKQIAFHLQNIQEKICCPLPSKTSFPAFKNERNKCSRASDTEQILVAAHYIYLKNGYYVKTISELCMFWFSRISVFRSFLTCIMKSKHTQIIAVFNLSLAVK